MTTGELIRDLCEYPSETEWLEFKENLADENEIGETAGPGVRSWLKCLFSCIFQSLPEGGFPELSMHMEIRRLNSAMDLL